MKIAITSRGNNLESKVDPRFGRGKGFVIYDIQNDSFKYVDNKMNMESPQGAGIQSAQNIVDQNAEVLITGNCGPKAFNVLKFASVKVYSVGDITVKEAVEKFKNNDLNKMNNANVQGHW